MGSLKQPSALSIDCYLQEVRYKPNGNHISKTTNKYATNKEKEIKYIIRENQQTIKDKRPEKIIQNNHKCSDNKLVSVSNYFECKWTKHPIKRQRVTEWT